MRSQPQPVLGLMIKKEVNPCLRLSTHLALTGSKDISPSDPNNAPEVGNQKFIEMIP